jgi:hypothetical protein
LFCSSIRNSIVSFSVVSLMAIVPESEWRIPTLMVSCALADIVAANVSANPAEAASQRLVCGRPATVLYFNMDDPRV